MPHDINEIKLHGRLGQDAEVRHFESGRRVVQCSIAVYRGKDKPPAWLNIKRWLDDGESVPLLTKGDRIYVEGRIDVETWKDRQTGAERSKVVVVASHISSAPLNGPIDSAGQAYAHAPQAAPATQSAPSYDAF